MKDRVMIVGGGSAALSAAAVFYTGTKTSSAQGVDDAAGRAIKQAFDKAEADDRANMAMQRAAYQGRPQFRRYIGHKPDASKYAGGDSTRAMERRKRQIAKGKLKASPVETIVASTIEQPEQ
jgi:hypothetical protein